MPVSAEQRILDEIATRPLLRVGDTALDEKTQGQNETSTADDCSVQGIERG
jgi:hypothetical protein